MAAEEKWKGWISKQHKEAEQAGEKEPCVLLGQQLGELGRFAYAALCGISLALLFPENEQSSFSTEFIEAFVKWLDLSDTVLPAMTAFAGGLGGEGTETFTEILLKDPILEENPAVITQDLLSFSLRDGYYDARARVLICHISLLLRIPLEELEVLEESLLESLKKQKEEESEQEAAHLSSLRVEKYQEQQLITTVDKSSLVISDNADGEASRKQLSHAFLEAPEGKQRQAKQRFVHHGHTEIAGEIVLCRHYVCSCGRTAEVSRKKKERRKKLKRYLLIGLATVGGGTVIGLTGGLAAPLVAAGAATIIGSAGAAALGSTAGIAVMASLFGAAGAGLTGYKMKKRVGAIEEFEFLPLTEGNQLHITIAITGWLCAGKYGSFTAPWSSMLQSSEQYCLAWESKYLMELGNALDSLLNGFVNMMAQEALKFTVLSGIVTALTWPTSLLTVASVIDNPWGVCLHRSAEVGKHLAHILLSRQQGKRPVTLIGFSLGARVIYFCLQEMAQEKESQGIIEDVVLLGAPVEGETKHWEALTKVVSGRIINGYCRGDWLLSFVYRTSSVQLNVAGLQPVDLDDRRMVNMDLSSVVNGHLDYMKQMDTILKAVGIKTKECQLVEEGSGSLFPPLAKKSLQEAGSEAGERKTPGKRRMRLGVRLSQPAALTDGIPPTVSWESPPCPAQTAPTAGTARTRQQKEQIRAELLSQH